MSRKMVRIAAVISLCVASELLPPSPVEAHDEPLIQPGAAAWFAHTPLGQFGPCTLNFVFRDATETYIGGPGRCTYRTGERVVMGNREFGTVVFRVLTPGDPGQPPETVDDFSLIRVDRSALGRVSPVVLDMHQSPIGVAKANTGQTAAGDTVFMTGAGVVFGSQWPTRHRMGTLLAHDARGFHAVIPASLGDSGAPVLHATSDELGRPESLGYSALGVLAQAAGANGAFGTTVERILQLLDHAGFHVKLVTGYDEDGRPQGRKVKS